MCSRLGLHILDADKPALYMSVGISQNLNADKDLMTRGLLGTCRNLPPAVAGYEGIMLVATYWFIFWLPHYFVFFNTQKL